MEASKIWKLVLGIAFVGLVFWWFYWRKGGRSGPREERKLQQVETKLMNGKLEPSEIVLKVDLPVQWLIHRYDSEPAD
ncbi:hypothetical protein IT157_04415 [bacterium]|nr:hypothetical protein [bacterium]